MHLFRNCRWTQVSTKSTEATIILGIQPRCAIINLCSIYGAVYFPLVQSKSRHGSKGLGSLRSWLALSGLRSGWGETASSTRVAGEVAALHAVRHARKTEENYREMLKSREQISVNWRGTGSVASFMSRSSLPLVVVVVDFGCQEMCSWGQRVTHWTGLVAWCRITQKNVAEGRSNYWLVKPFSLLQAVRRWLGNTNSHQLEECHALMGLGGEL